MRRILGNAIPMFALLVILAFLLVHCHALLSVARPAARSKMLLHGTGTDTDSHVPTMIDADVLIDAFADSSTTAEPSAELEHPVHHQYSPIYPNISAIEPLPVHETTDEFNEITSRRTWFARVARSALVGGTAVGGAAIYRYMNPTATTSQSKRLDPVNMTAVAKETRINITIQCSRTCVTLDETTFQKKQTLKVPSWFPAQLVPPPRVIKDIPNSELLVAAIVAGSAVEMVRTTLLYPLQTLKTRIQTDINKRERTVDRQLHIRRRVKVMRLKTIRHFREGQLYAGLLPSLLISVPATGCYYGARDISKRMLTPFPINDIYMALAAAFFADVISLALRTPADTLALRLQVAMGEEGGREHDDDQVAEQIADALAEARVDEKVGNWFTEALERIPAVIATDLPYLLSRIALNSFLIQGQVVDVGHYEIAAFSSAVLCAFLTTPFDVARTRILVDSDADVTNGVDGGSGHGLIETFRIVLSEGGGGVRNLFAGWLERTAYLGIASLLLPFGLILYSAIRNTILLEVFD